MEIVCLLSCMSTQLLVNTFILLFFCQFSCLIEFLPWLFLITEISQHLFNYQQRSHNVLAYWLDKNNKKYNNEIIIMKTFKAKKKQWLNSVGRWLLGQHGQWTFTKYILVYQLVEIGIDEIGLLKISIGLTI